MTSCHRDKPSVLICAPNWIGDSIMSMPAIQCFRRDRPGVHIALLAKSGVAPLWQLHPAPDDVIALPPGAFGTLRCAFRLRCRSFQQAFILPNSFRSAWIPWLAGVPERIGFRGHFRRLLLTNAMVCPDDIAQRHQAWEYMRLLCPHHAEFASLEEPALRIPPETREALARLLDAARGPYLVLLPGAARGPSKRWPAEHFVALGRKWTAEVGARVVVSGAPDEKHLCEKVAQGIGSGALNLAGRTTLKEWAALLAAAELVVCNDSGGMHLASAVGTPVIALYGITDPAKTGPLGQRALVLQRSPERHRDVPRRSADAAKWLASITPEQVYQEALKMWRARK
jgi:heptosyltransferase-2